jgi:hypothetical protein
MKEAKPKIQATAIIPDAFLVREVNIFSFSSFIVNFRDELLKAQIQAFCFKAPFNTIDKPTQVQIQIQLLPRVKIQQMQ